MGMIFYYMIENFTYELDLQLRIDTLVISYFDFEKNIYNIYSV